MNKISNYEKIINGNVKFTAILTRGYKRHCLIPNLINQFDKRVLLWQTMDRYYPCSRIQLYYGTGLKYLVDYCENDFDVLIVNSFIENFNTKETIEFIEYVATSEKFKNKQFVFIFTGVDNQNIALENYENYKDIIKKFCEDIYVLRGVKDYGFYEMENLSSGEIKKYYRGGFAGEQESLWSVSNE